MTSLFVSRQCSRRTVISEAPFADVAALSYRSQRVGKRIVDSLKPLAEICVPDSRQTAWVRLDASDGSMRPLTLEDHYTSIEQITLSSDVPEDIRQHMETAKNLALYSWFVYRFTPAAELHAYSAFEWALRIRLKIDDDRPPKFSAMLGQAIRQGFYYERRIFSSSQTLTRLRL